MTSESALQENPLGRSDVLKTSEFVKSLIPMLDRTCSQNFINVRIISSVLDDGIYDPTIVHRDRMQHVDNAGFLKLQMFEEPIYRVASKAERNLFRTNTAVANKMSSS